MKHPLQLTNVHHRVCWTPIVEFGGRDFPMVFLDGEPSYVINQWIFSLLGEGITPSLLEERVRAITQLWEFYRRKYGKRPLTDEEAKKLIPEFLRAKRWGTIPEDGSVDPLFLYWRANHNRNTLKRYVFAINAFDRWQSVYHGAKRMNPSETQFMTAAECYSDLVNRQSWDAMLHLFPSRAHTKTVHAYELSSDHRRFLVGRYTIPKAFPINRFVELVETSPNPRDQMLWLLIGGAGIRALSETLNLYYEDILGVDEFGAARIRLDDPEIGRIRWPDSKGEWKEGTRTKFLAEAFRSEEFREALPELYPLKPRPRLRKGSRYWAGWKGMTFHANPYQANRPDGSTMTWQAVQWIHPAVGARFYAAFEEYRNRYFSKHGRGWPYHPYLFIELTKDRLGLPFTRAGIRKAWMRAMKRLGLEDSGLGPYSLRHMYGSYCANVLKLSLDDTMMAMHHANSTSTRKYYRLHSDALKNIFIKAITSESGRGIADYVILPNAPQLTFPESWGFHANPARLPRR